MLRTFDNPTSPIVRILVLAVGNTHVSELRPALELAKALSSQKGVVVDVATHNRFRTQVKDLNLGFEDCGLDPIEARKGTEAGKTLETNKSDPSTVGIALKGFMDTLVADWCKTGMKLLLSNGPDVAILASSAAIYCYLPICEENFIQSCILSGSPCIPTMAFPPPKAFRGVNAIQREPTCTGQWAIYCQSVWRFLYKDPIDEQCMQLYGGEPHPSPFGPLETVSKGSANSSPLVLHAYSQVLLPRPNDWLPHVHVVGSLGGVLGPLPENDFKSECLSENIKAFFSVDPEALTVLIDLGSYFEHWQDEASRTQLLKQCITAVTSGGYRAIVVTSASNIHLNDDILDENCLIIPAVPLGSEYVLCRKCACVIFTGEPFLAHCALRAATPLITLRLSGYGSNRESTAECEFWGKVYSLKNVSPPSIDANNLTISQLHKILNIILKQESLQQLSAKVISLQMQEEEGCDKAIKAVKLVMNLANPIASIRSAAAKV